MKKSMKSQMSKIFSGNVELNKKALNMKRSFDEVNKMIGKGNQKKTGK
ncbi:MAG: hypothetical protein K0S61_1004 [Anaerocolumna sp.]|jgi:hypothetical protein|nr:hypothetical protein [Anaerocolumna sp.]